MPLRRCVGCGRVAPKADLVRLAACARPGERRPALVRLDPAGRLPGRGAYLCAVREAGREDDQVRPRRDCLERALTRKALPRAFRRSVDVHAELVESVGR